MEQIGRLTYWLPLIVCLSVSPFSNYDPISLPKMFVLSAGSFLLLGIIFPLIRNLDENLKKLIFFLSLIFLIGLLIPLTFSPSPLTQQFWGVFGRNTGMLTYFSLFILLSCTIVIQNEETYERISKSLFVTGVISSIYGFLQFLGKDPVKWSSQDVFGTLGNTNFFSALLGMSTVITFSLVLSTLGEKRNFSPRFPILLVVFLFELFILIKSDSIQGPVILIAGVAITCFAKIRIAVKPISRIKQQIILYVYSITVILLGITSVAGLQNTGPLAKYLFSPTVWYRKDYMGAALRMFEKYPITGIGLDSYGDWYRAFRDPVAAFRTSLTRTANTSHNIYLDLFAGGGVLLGLTYLSLTVFALFCALQLLRMANTFEPWTVSIAAALFAYDLQAIISINQIGVGVWGWSLKGTAIGLYFFRKRELIHEETSSSNGKVKKSVKHRQFNSPTKNLPPFSIISGMVFGLIGLLIAMPPLQADISFRKSYFSGSLPSMFNATGKLGTTAWHLGLVQEVAARANEGDFAIKMNGRLTQKFPREFYGWQWRVASPLLSDSQRTSSYKVLRTLDPNFFCFEQDSGNRVKQIIMRLSMPEQVELARSWGLIDGNKAAGDSFSLNSNFPNQLEEKSIGYCR